jgi:hypothetical protein
MNIWTFKSTGDAYDECQCSDVFEDGDVLLVPSEQVAGVLVEAWPTTVTTEAGAFHQIDPEVGWERLDDGKYYPAAQVATVCAMAMIAGEPIPNAKDGESAADEAWQRECATYRSATTLIYE